MNFETQNRWVDFTFQAASGSRATVLSYKDKLKLSVVIRQFLSFVEKGTGIEHSEDQLGSYWSPTGIEGGTWITKAPCQR